ncbi:MAG: PepSY-like domain-containing protein [Bacteroides sp.]|nr:PepSY-like domain-containing protein [Bacteroides sp.]
MMATTASVFAGENINESELPRRARNLITACFADDAVASVEKDYNARGTEYEVELTSGTDLDFNNDGTLRKISAAPGHAINSDLIPAKIRDYMSLAFPDASATKILKYTKGYAIELSDGDCLLFDSDENFVKTEH